MSDIPISAVTDRTTTQSTTTKPNDELGKDAFLQLLVAQLKYQDPMNPSDSTEFLSQTAQFTMVEKLEQLAADTTASRVMSESISATGMLGKQITWIGADGTEQSGVVSGASFGAGGAVLHVGDHRVPLELVSGVHTVTAPTPATGDDTAAEATTETTGETGATDPTAATGTDTTAATDAPEATDAAGDAGAAGTDPSNPTDPTDQTTTQEA